MDAWTRIGLAAAAFSAVSVASPAVAQVCTGVGYYEACLDAIGGRAPGDDAGVRDPSRIVDDIFRTSDTPPRFGPELTFGQVVVARSVFNSAGCSGGRSAGAPGLDPRQYTAYQCDAGLTATQAARYVNALDWWWVQNMRVRPAGGIANDQDSCGGDRTSCGFETPWLSGVVFDLQGPSNRVVVFPITDHVTDSCLEAFEYSVYLTDDPLSREIVPLGGNPDARKWNRAVLTRAFLRGWTDNYQSVGTVADMTVHPLTTGRGTTNEAVADSIATVWSLPCGITFRYVAVVPGNWGNPDARCAFYSNEDEFDAVAGLNEDGSAVCPDVDQDGFRDARCGGNDCDDTDAAVNPAAFEDCASARDVNCDGTVAACPFGTTCIRGFCAPPCVEGGCADGFRCEMTDGGSAACVPNACGGTACPPGQRCGPRGCQLPCDGAVCPPGQACLGGACVDECAGVRCSTNQHCEVGLCRPNCACTGCASGQTCNGVTGRCEIDGCNALPCPVEERDCRSSPPRCRSGPCDGTVCPLGQRCDVGRGGCVPDLCFGVVCLTGAHCDEGRCVEDPQPDAGPDASPRIDAGVPAEDAATVPMDASPDGSFRRTVASGCACRATTAVPAASWTGVAWLVAAALGLGLHRRPGHAGRRRDRPARSPAPEPARTV